MTSSGARGTAELKGHPWPEAPKRNSYHDRASSANPSGAPTPRPQEVWPTPALAAWPIRNLLELEAPKILPFFWTSLCSSPCSTPACLTGPRCRSPVLHLPTLSPRGHTGGICFSLPFALYFLLSSPPLLPSDPTPAVSFLLSPPSSSLILSSSSPSMSRAMNSQRELGPERVGPSGNKDQEAGVPAGATHTARGRGAHLKESKVLAAQISVPSMSREVSLLPFWKTQRMKGGCYLPSQDMEQGGKRPNPREDGRAPSP